MRFSQSCRSRKLGPKVRAECRRIYFSLSRPWMDRFSQLFLRTGIEAQVMTSGHRSVLAKVAVCALFVAATAPSTAQSSTPIGGVTHSDAVWIGVAVAAIGVGVGIGIYYAVHHGHSLSGCAVSASDGLQLQNRGDGQTYTLSGEVAGIKPGDRVRVSGKKAKNTGGPQQFVVEKLTKDYGVCTVQSPAQ